MPHVLGAGGGTLYLLTPHIGIPPLQVNANGSVLLSEIVGTIKLKVFLSGMPELRLGLNDRVLFELTGRKIGGGTPSQGWATPRRRPVLR